ncbi:MULTISPECIES: hypothetical protein [Bacillus]|uniref:hypothetical protein n=1 Tax=Bacillus TaxID=1386 RepID=UPI00295E59BF|nr:hypothetical protein [Bacillus velezensis]MDW0355686.1 hypothetical protein [Bacillus velezensis]MEE1861602.1 hypothetical protein [Bacillus velezensis]
MLKATKILISFMALLLAVYSLFNQSGFLLISLQVLVAVLFIIVGLELLSKKQKSYGYIFFGTSAFILAVNIIKFMI